ncbi:UDP-N-acetylglucosamine 2-epimerase [Psychrobacillus sp. FJAT-51614]|uniref:UDP-N-acetylglucosamine 2-epimerase n=1 Tax=Psychrobacillus mangrovi TaxID=3117745 RepID=A0ABU8F6F5_9BACI
MKKKICVVTGTRAEYGLLYWLMSKIQKDKELQMQLIVTGMHLSPEFGLTYQQIEKDGFIIDQKIEMLLSGDTPSAIVKSIGLGVIGFADAYQSLKPDLVILLGDRFEIFAATQAAMVSRIPIAHIHGGELTEGLIDDPIRHSITKMSHIHFTASEEYRKRIIQMGEQPDTVFNVGTLGLEGIKNTSLLSLEAFKESIQFDMDKFFLVTLHPTTLEESTAEEQIKILLSSLDEFKNYKILFTKTNADTDGRIINRYIEQYVQKNKNRCTVFDSLGQHRYLSAIKHCSAVIGNSSSGLVEVPFFLKPTINIGDRQRGRLKANSVIDCNFEKNEILRAIKKGISNNFNLNVQSMQQVYGSGNTSEDIIHVLKQTSLDTILKKKFYDIE